MRGYTIFISMYVCIFIIFWALWTSALNKNFNEYGPLIAHYIGHWRQSSCQKYAPYNKSSPWFYLVRKSWSIFNWLAKGVWLLLLWHRVTNDPSFKFFLRITTKSGYLRFSIEYFRFYRPVKNVYLLHLIDFHMYVLW